eukprot:TRINITY_DN13252_c0_g1_i1.p1 TRINITY_DN13252_c0_g1~~TRINITY_DN13252_c0_g1_i1.p1  ORF type:complete len:231 (+),score=55.64 TRINITY_DN13252_c0_g1_i1:65-757(+)
MNSLADLAAMRQMPTDTSIPGWDHPRRRDTSELGRHAKSDCARRRSLADVPIIFNILDTDNTKDLSFVEFVNGLHRLKNENAHTLAIFTKHFAEKMYEGWGDISDLQSMVQKQEDALRLLIKRFNNVDHISSSPEASPRSSDGNALADIVKAATLAQPPDDQLPEPFVFAEKSPRSPQLSEGGEEEAPQSFPLSLSPALLSAKPDCVRLGNAQGFRTTWTAEVVEEECAS